MEKSPNEPGFNPADMHMYERFQIVAGFVYGAALLGLLVTLIFSPF